MSEVNGLHDAEEELDFHFSEEQLRYGSNKIERFEDFIAWQKARSLTKAVYRFTKRQDVARDFGYTGQIRRSAVSVMSNIAEGFERHNRVEFHQFLSIAKGSAAEVRSLLYVGLDAEYLSQQEFTSLMSAAEEVSRLVAGLRAAVANQRTSRPAHRS